MSPEYDAVRHLLTEPRIAARTAAHSTASRSSTRAPMFKNRLERVFHSRVARRLGLAFILSALLPVAGLGVLTVVRIGTELEAQARYGRIQRAGAVG